MRTAVYVARGRGGGPIYVGISNRPHRRWAQHRASKEWAAAVHTWEVIVWCPTRREALSIEARLIDEFDPPANIAGARTPWVDWTRIRTRARWGRGVVAVGVVAAVGVSIVMLVLKGTVGG